MFKFPRAYFGKVNSVMTNWRNKKIDNYDKDNDEELPTDKDTIRLLGFDPAKYKSNKQNEQH